MITPILPKKWDSSTGIKSMRLLETSSISGNNEKNIIIDQKPIC